MKNKLINHNQKYRR